MAGLRIASAYWFRAEGAVIPWSEVFERELERLRGAEVDERLLARRKEAIGKTPVQVALRWSCADRLGVPIEPFTVWVRLPHDEAKQVDVQESTVDGGTRLSWRGAAAIIQVSCDVVDPSRAVGLFASRGGLSLRETVGAVSVRQPNGGRVSLDVRTPGATRALLVNGTNPQVGIRLLQDVLDDPGWRELERVGLPADDPWAGTAYRPTPQGLVTALTDPVTAALERLDRGSPPIGWEVATETGRLAPTWAAPDPTRLVEEIRKTVLPVVEPILAPGILPPDQAAVPPWTPTVAGPQRGTRAGTLPASAKMAALSLLTLPAASEPFLALGLGFGTAYRLEDGHDVGIDGPLSRAEFLVTGEYDETPRRTGPATVCAYVPSPAVHGRMTRPTNLVADRAGLVAPDATDEPWRESVRVTWDRLPSAAALGRPSGALVARFDPAGAPVAEALVERRPAGDLRPLIPVPDGPPDTPGHARTSLVDRAAEIPLGSGGRSAGYAVAVEDVFGVWSTWEDVTYSGLEPGPPLPRVLALSLSSTYSGAAVCPATLEVELSVDWADRTPTGVDLAASFFPMSGPNAGPPPGIDPDLPAPPGCFRRDVAIPFTGASLGPASGLTIDHLDSAGQELVAPGNLQGIQGRRYRVRLPIPTLDFGSTPRWGVQVWLRTSLLALPGVMPWSPDPGHPALTAAASPVPAAPLPAPLPPGVPLGSTPDAQGQSHARVLWSIPAGSDVATVVVWEASESAIRSAASEAPRAPDGQLPGWRLADLRVAYDGLTPARRRSAFRKLRELPGTARDTDIALPKGSTDIHLFAVTTITSTGVESPWPAGTPAHEQLQAVMAPRLRQPAAPTLRTTVAADGTVTMRAASASRIPVQWFRLFRTRSAVAARSAETMGPPFAVVGAVAPAPGTLPDPGTGELTYTATWSGSFDPSWDEWLVRAVAVPVDGVPPEAVRGIPSPACDVVGLVVLPPGPPDLALLVGDIWGAAHDGVVVRASTSAPVRTVALGSHRIGGNAGADTIALVSLESLAEDLAEPPAGATPGPALVRGERATGRTPLSVWFTRPVAADPVAVTLRVVDPLGRITEQALTVPGWVPPAPPTLDLLDVVTLVGRGTVVTIRSDAPIDASPPFVMDVVARRSGGRRPTPFPPLGIPQVLTRSFPLDTIPERPGPFPLARPIQAIRTTGGVPFEYEVLIRMEPPFAARVTIVAPDGARASIDVAVP